MFTQLYFSSQPLHESPDHNSSYSHQNGISGRLFSGAEAIDSAKCLVNHILFGMHVPTSYSL
ncbi:DEHA2G07194p [Debaryomyces hansenii CBS767]|uniref:DEHA2G07194p n=1 Tax=Debaryomyces hansenii (strain ATCC 36239 / CBS 767 / BCRC 21394 / JCM 1990 / NBRC 0083 / IGC 2968) TaxID=284592 RepID=Q6BIW0_DEBHA|nr:DEHA2G07194p [Debaryomyces hansenii CBS767]CAG90322.2 DEHA2G07194p [Debaryomyces hansenii CBS767]|eukprot:XP_461861.2 DEHA2G07194p [Debaryomyces hansenii CBS767]